MADASILLDRARAAKEVAMLTAMTLIRTNGDPEQGLALLESISDVAPAEGDELDAVALSAQAIREAMSMGVNPL